MSSFLEASSSSIELPASNLYNQGTETLSASFRGENSASVMDKSHLGADSGFALLLPVLVLLSDSRVLSDAVMWPLEASET